MALKTLCGINNWAKIMLVPFYRENPGIIYDTATPSILADFIVVSNTGPLECTVNPLPWEAAAIGVQNVDTGVRPPECKS